jgi:hypothetical protein
MVIDGTSFRYYTASCSVPKWFNVEITGIRGRAASLPPVYPPEPVKDGNPGWDQ